MIESLQTYPLRLATNLAPPQWQWTVAIGLYSMAIVMLLLIVVLGWLVSAVLVDLIRRTVARASGRNERGMDD